MFTHRIFHINDVTPLVPLSDSVMSEHGPGVKRRRKKKAVFHGGVSVEDVRLFDIQKFSRCSPVEVLSCRDGQRASVSAWTKQHVTTVWVSLQEDFSLGAGHRTKTPASPKQCTNNNNNNNKKAFMRQTQLTLGSLPLKEQREATEGLGSDCEFSVWTSLCPPPPSTSAAVPAAG